MNAARTEAPPAAPDTVREELVRAVIEAQDRLHAVRALGRIGLSTLDRDDAVSAVAVETRSLLHADAVLVRDDGLQWSAGELAGTGLLDAMGAPTDGRPVRTAADGRVVLVSAPAAPRRVVGVARRQGPAFHTDDLLVVEAVLESIAVIATVHELHRVALEHAEAEGELAAASAMAQGVLAAEPVGAAGVELAAETVPARSAGGDFWITVLREDVLWCAVGDVAGKGLPAAVVMAKAVGAVRGAVGAVSGTDTASAVRSVEDDLFDYLEDTSRFVTLVLAAVDLRHWTLEIANAGHSPVMLVEDDEVRDVPAGGPPIGIVRGERIEVTSRPFRVGTTLVLGSDGLTDQRSPGGRMFGSEELRNVCRREGSAGAAAVAAAVMDAVVAHADGSAADDDRTVLVLRRTNDQDRP